MKVLIDTWGWITFTLLFRRLSSKQAFLSLDIIEEAIKNVYLI
ncbi:MAG: hypothetical protein ACYDA4_17010 [Ignavibacteriaceae bacterium]